MWNRCRPERERVVVFLVVVVVDKRVENGLENGVEISKSSDSMSVVFIRHHRSKRRFRENLPSAEQRATQLLCLRGNRETSEHG